MNVFNPIEHSIYDMEHYKKKIHNYARFLNLFRLDLDVTTQQNWAELASLARSIDNYLDFPSEIDLNVREDSIRAYLSTCLGNTYGGLANLGPARTGHLIKLTDRIFFLNRQFKGSTKLLEFKAARIEEGRSYAEMFILTAEEPTRSQANFGIFGEVFTRVGAATNLVNSSLGIHQDSREGQVSLNPLVSIQVNLIGSAVRELVRPSIHSISTIQ